MSSPVDCLEIGSLIINREHRDLLDRLGFLDFDAIWNWEGGQRIKDIRERSVIRIPVEHGGRKTHLYLKKHKGGGTGFTKWIPHPWLGKRTSPGRREFDNIRLFRDQGLGTVVPIAAGEKESPTNGIQSFILTEDFFPYVQLEALLKDDPAFFMGEPGASRKEALLTEIARLADRMHQAGLNHQDFNATHILLYYGRDSDRPHLALFDLQRVEIGGGWRYRWPIKSVARLNYTLPEDLFSPADRVRLWLAYKGKERMSLWDMMQWFWIQRKTRRIARHTSKIMDRRRSAGENRLGGWSSP